jgi:hypothetical protein
MAGAALNDTYKRKEEIEERGLQGSQERRHSNEDDRELDLQEWRSGDVERWEPAHLTTAWGEGDEHRWWNTSH